MIAGRSGSRDIRVYSIYAVIVVSLVFSNICSLIGINSTLYLFSGSARIDFSMSSLIRPHSAASNAGPGATVTIFLSRKVGSIRQDEPASGR